MSIMGKARPFAVLGVAALVGALSGCVVDHNNCNGPAMHVTWDIVSSTNAPLSCLQAGADTVDISVGDMDIVRPCVDYAAITPTFAPGSYPVNLTLLDIGSHPLSTFTAPTTVDFFNCQITDLGNVTFPVNSP
jgi:hypothetical protein